MLKTGILNPFVLSLLARTRHTNLLVIADRGLPFWPSIETVDLSLVDDIPTVLQVFTALKSNFIIGQIIMAEEFMQSNAVQVQQQFAEIMEDIPVMFEPHREFKKRIPNAVGLIRTGDTIQYGNMILVSA